MVAFAERVSGPAERAGATAPSPRQLPAVGSPSFREVFEQMGRELDTGAEAIERALRITPSGAPGAAMLALQANVYRYVEVVELCARLVDRSTSAVRTTLQSQ